MYENKHMEEFEKGRHKVKNEVIHLETLMESSKKNYVDDILDEISDDDTICEEKKVNNNENDYYYINDIIKRNYPLEYEENNIYPKIYCYEPTNFEKFKKKIKNKNELRHYECYSSTMNEFFYKYNENYYYDILKNESFKKFAEELWSNRSTIKTETQYQELCIKLRKKYKVSPSKHQISVALQHYYLQTLNSQNEDKTNDIDIKINNSKEMANDDDTNLDKNENENNDDKNIKQCENMNNDDKNIKQCENMNNGVKNLNEIENLSDNENNEDDVIINKKGKDVKFVMENVNKMIITKEMKNYKDLDLESVQFLQINKRKGVRSNSGVLVITLITHPHKFSCKYDCHYCPNEPNQPRSYLSTEPAILRANQNNFDVICQFFNRTTTLVNNGHVPDKIEVLVLGGTWSCYDVEYQEEFIRDVYYSANIYPVLKNRRKKLSLKEEQEINELSNCRIIGLTLETRPDQINKNELLRLRYYGCTRVQLGIQHTDDFILKKVNRQCTVKDCIRAIYLLKENGFKVDIHLMPDLPYSNVYKDIDMFKYILSSTDLQADQWKIYPCEVTPFTKIEKWYNNNEYKPYFENDKNLLICLILLVKKSIHPWIRLNRVIRDIPNPSIIAGNNITNMRQLITHEMNIRNVFCQCIRCKEIKNQEIEKNKNSIFLKIYKYPTLGGDEFFITFQGKKILNNSEKSSKLKKKNKNKKKMSNINEEKFNNNNINNNDNIINNKENFISDNKKNNTYKNENEVNLNGKNSNFCNYKEKSEKLNSDNLEKIYNNNYGDDDDDDYDNKYALLGFLRLRLRHKNNFCDDRPFKCLENSSLIRELHVYGSLLKHDDFKDELNFIQHKGLGKCLVLVAEIISYFYNYKKMSIIAGVGTREYYKKLGYSKEETYMTKTLKKEDIYKNYLLNFDKIGDKIIINNYNLKHCLYLMHKKTPEPPKYKRSEINDLNLYINENIIPLNSSNYLSYKDKCTISIIDIQSLLTSNKITDFLNILKKLTTNYIVKNRIIFSLSTFVFFSTAFMFSLNFLKKKKINIV
ncbi:histone S-adenosyl methyltransferase, putative [Plasmodium gallinaceum]|uniref:Histone S-adenosyl methyltransferase, putative n=1 Tax=Plasmodium gallinaceum TaxID=5849 RepID=A0A1J1GMC6_PLAGA|nr:histone S-adenosyl methyltransferase, putative [Plasmodium gallinaceum]CRG93582.1 histone S-adenosyl methyltransferase, putative [Plasmodium gallinaceum]